MKNIICYIVLLICCFSAYSQKNNKFQVWEDSLISLRNEVMNEPDETTRLELNEEFMTTLEYVLQMPYSFKHPWDSVKNFSILNDPDGLFKIFTWYVIKKDYSIENFGFIQVYNEQRKKYVLFPLYDQRDAIDYPKTMVGNHTRWYGAVYYKLIPLKSKDDTFYTLLGWNGNNIFTNQKVIEILHFNRDMVPVFGARIFKNFPERVSRIIFEYSKNATLHLNYENQQYLISSGKYNPKTQQLDYKSFDSPMIIFDELIPMDEKTQNIAAYMVPESSLNQGFIEDNGKWVFMKSVRGTNPDKVKPEYHIKTRQFYKPN